MSALERLSKAELRDLLVTNWMTHDAMWFASSARLCGIEKTNVVNRGAAKAMAEVEAQRLQKALGVARIVSFDQLQHFLGGAFELVRGPFMKFTLTYPEANLMRWETEQCFVHDGVSKLGMIDRYECGVFDRLEGWLESLGIEFRVTPEIDGCFLHRLGRCVREYRFAFQPAAGGAGTDR
ncbi:MAG: DUF6125 family protein [Burkholderiales bacterium]